jgi:U3 small nucleolar RNA-associated protein 19
LFDTEANRRIKKEPALAVELGKTGRLFPVALASTAAVDTVEEPIQVEDGDVVSELWIF